MNIGGPLAFASEALAGWNAREAGKAQSKALKKQARAAWLEANAAEESQRRAARKAFGELRASGAQAGLTSSVTFDDVYTQSATEAELDALNIRYQGLTARQGLLFDARMANAMRPKWGEILISAGARGLGASAGNSYPQNNPPVRESIGTIRVPRHTRP